MLLGKAENVLEELPICDVESWNALILGYIQYQCGKDALKCLEVMQCEGIFPDIVTFTDILKAYGALGEICKSKQIHDEIICKSLLEENDMLGNAFVDMYVKWDDLEKPHSTGVLHIFSEDNKRCRLDCWFRSIENHQ